MGASFTKGPWIAPEGPFVGGHFVHTTDADICEMPDWPLEHRHEEEANANLIAAAPDLYEALACLLGRFVEIESDQASEAIIARAALAKAQGRPTSIGGQGER